MDRAIIRTLVSCAVPIVLGAPVPVAPLQGQGQNPPAVLVLEGPYDVMANGEMHLAVGQGIYVNVRAVSGVAQTFLSNPNGVVWTSSDQATLAVAPYPGGTTGNIVAVTGMKDGAATINYKSQFGTASLKVTVGKGLPQAVGGTITPLVSGTITVSRPAAPVGAQRATAPTAATSARPMPDATPMVREAGGNRQLPGARVITTTSVTKAAPTNFAAENIPGGRVAFSWSAVSGAVGYMILEGANTPAMYRQVNGAWTSVFTDTALLGGPFPAGPHSYRVEAVYLEPGETVPTPDFSNARRSSLPSSTVSLTVPRWTGVYRVTLNGFAVNQETLDNPVEIDGKRDEVYFQSTAVEFDSTGKAVGPPRMVTSYTYGDINHPDWTDPNKPTYRIRAGSASDKGGLMTGDKYPSATPWVRAGTDGDRALPLILWEGRLSEGENSVMVVPTVWENDQKPDNLAAEHKLERDFIEAVGEYAMQRFPEVVRLASAERRGLSVGMSRDKKLIESALVRADQVEGKIIERLGLPGTQGVPIQQIATAVRTNLTTLATTMQANLNMLLNLKDRPIGMTKRPGGGYDYHPYMLNLSYENVEGLIKGGGLTGKGPGIIEVPYVDTTPNGGNYTLFVEVRRLP